MGRNTPSEKSPFACLIQAINLDTALDMLFFADLHNCSAVTLQWVQKSLMKKKLFSTTEPLVKLF
jgi:hypothetical protein